MKLGDIIEGIQILARYEKKGFDARGSCAEHDQVWIGNCKTPVDEEDRKRLVAMGWFFDRNVDRWSFDP